MVICCLSIAPTAWGTFHLVLNFLHPFPLIRAIRAVQIFILEFSKDGSADLGDEYAADGAANQPVVLQEGVGLSSGQVSRGYDQFESNFLWFPEIGD